MSDKAAPVDGASAEHRNPFVSIKEEIIKDAMILFGWIAAMLVIAGVCWVLTQPVRNRFLVRAVNRVLAQSGDSRRLTGPVLSGGRGSLLSGSWFAMTGGGSDRAFVFSFIGDGAFFPCAAIITQDGKVREFVPLNSYGERALKRVSPGILNIYTRRIEGAGS